MRRGSQSGPAGWSANDRVSSQFDSLARKKKSLCVCHHNKSEALHSWNIFGFFVSLWSLTETLFQLRFLFCFFLSQTHFHVLNSEYKFHQNTSFGHRHTQLHKSSLFQSYLQICGQIMQMLSQ